MKKPSAAPTVLSVIAFAFSVLAVICGILNVILMTAGPEGGTATALTGRAVLLASGMIFLTAAAWGFAIIAVGLGIAMTITDSVTKRFRILWMPIAAIILGIAGVVINAAAF